MSYLNPQHRVEHFGLGSNLYLAVKRDWKGVLLSATLERVSTGMLAGLSTQRTELDRSDLQQLKAVLNQEIA